MTFLFLFRYTVHTVLYFLLTFIFIHLSCCFQGARDIRKKTLCSCFVSTHTHMIQRLLQLYCSSQANLPSVCSIHTAHMCIAICFYLLNRPLEIPLLFISMGALSSCLYSHSSRIEHGQESRKRCRIQK